MKRIAACLYLLAGIGSTLFCLQSILWAVWGAPTHWPQFVGLFSSLLLAAGAVGLLVLPERRQLVCALGVVGMGFFYVPAVVSVIPAHSLVVSPIVYVIEFGYAALAASVLFYPQRIPRAPVGLAAILLAMVGFAAVTATQRYYSGEFDAPAIVCFKAHRSPEPLIVPREFESLFAPSVRADLRQKGIGGRIEWRASINDQTLESKLVVVATSKVTSALELHYPKHGTVVYLWDGTSLSSLPGDSPRYPSFATLRADGMIGIQDATGGVESSLVYSWR